MIYHVIWNTVSLQVFIYIDFTLVSVMEIDYWVTKKGNALSCKHFPSIIYCMSNYLKINCKKNRQMDCRCFFFVVELAPHPLSLNSFHWPCLPKHWVIIFIYLGLTVKQNNAECEFAHLLVFLQSIALANNMPTFLSKSYIHT